MKFEPQKMTGWYDPRQLAATGLRAVISGLFGNYADNREMQAALIVDNPYHDYTKDEDFKDNGQEKENWTVDFIADLGDGFDATYSVAHLLAKPSITVKAEGETPVTISRGDILIMGGDQVYPTPQQGAYRNRLQGPYNAAFPWVDGDKKRPHLYAIPGNHDWYDGLNNFIKIFCQGRALGNWLTHQKRSYFAFKLPFNCWIWGTDVQLNSDIDKPQLDYFEKLAAIMKKEAGIARVILVTAEPAWVYKSINPENTSYQRLEFFQQKYIRENGFKLVATLTGDLHHYSRYQAILKKERDAAYSPGKPDFQDAGGSPEEYITAGGGGAFMHPTHMLKKSIQFSQADKNPDGIPPTDRGTSHYKLHAQFPSADESIKMARGNFVFVFYNKLFALILGVFHLLTAWILQSTTKYLGTGCSFMEQLSRETISPGSIWPVVKIVCHTLAHNPQVIVLNLILISGTFVFTDIEFGKLKWNWIFGALHAIVQFVCLYIFIWFISRINLETLCLPLEEVKQVLLFFVEMTFIGGAVSGLIFGLYLWFSTRILLSHPTEAFSSMRIADYKNFLRIHFTKDGITIYPIGIRKIAHWKRKPGSSSGKPEFTGATPLYQLIEKPITLHK